MKKILAAFLGIALAAACQLSYAAAAVVTGLTGTVQATGAGATRTLNVGSTIDEGETVVTGAKSSTVLRFTDGQVVGMPEDSRVAVTAYRYERAQPEQNNVFLTLLVGTMRAVTGLIGRQQPLNVAYRSGTATIGIRGTDVLINRTTAGRTILHVTDGGVSITIPGQQPVVLLAGSPRNAGLIDADNVVQIEGLESLLGKLLPADQARLRAIINDGALAALIQQAVNFGPGGNPLPGSTPGSTSPN